MSGVGRLCMQGVHYPMLLCGNHDEGEGVLILLSFIIRFIIRTTARDIGAKDHSKLAG